MMNNLGDLPKFGQANMETSMKMFGEWTKNMQAIAAEMTDYTLRSFSNVDVLSSNDRFV